VPYSKGKKEPKGNVQGQTILDKNNKYPRSRVLKGGTDRKYHADQGTLEKKKERGTRKRTTEGWERFYSWTRKGIQAEGIQGEGDARSFRIRLRKRPRTRTEGCRRDKGSGVH